MSSKVAQTSQHASRNRRLLGALLVKSGLICMPALGYAQIVTVNNVFNNGYAYNAFPGSCPAGYSVPSEQIPAGRHLERAHVIYNSGAGTWVMYAHYENNNYTVAEVMVFTSPVECGPYAAVSHFRPLGYESRDDYVFEDPDDHSAYLITASNKNGGANDSMAIFKLTSDYLGVDPVAGVTWVFENAYREAPVVIKAGGVFYLLTSQAAGWYPSWGGYATSKSVLSGWSSLNRLGNSSTFGGQEADVLTIKGSLVTSFVMVLDHLSGAGDSGSMWLPLTLDPQAQTATLEWYSAWSIDMTTGVVTVPQNVNLAASGTATASSSLASNPPQMAADGDYGTEWVSAAAGCGLSSCFPAWWMVDLGSPRTVQEVDVSWYMVKGSEGCYKYTIDYSNDGSSFTSIDRSSNTLYGFTSDRVSFTARYVRITLLDAVLQNNPHNNWYTPQLWEVKLLGPPPVNGNPPDAPVLVAPANDATGVGLMPTLEWNASTGATSYDVYLGTASAQALVANTANLSYALNGPLSLGTIYYWQIAAKNAAGSASSATWSFTVTSSPSGDPALRFVPVTPCRLADARYTSILTGGASRDFVIPQLGCGVPSSAQAYSLNVTAVPSGYLGYLAIWPTGQPQPNASTLNSWQGIVVANAAIVPAGANGAVSVYVSNHSDVILDINGYFDTSSGPTSYSFYPATPCRVVDTRNPAGQFAGPELDGTNSRDFPIPLDSCSIPATARGYALNFTVVPPGYLGFLTTWPTGQPRPNASTLNSWAGKVVANAALIPAGTNESVSVYGSNATQLIMDINGYFGQPGSAGALSFYPVAPCRVADTRGSEGSFGGPEMEGPTTRVFPIPASACNIPTTAAAYSLNVTVVPDGPLSYLTIWPAGSAQPNVSTLNSFDGSVVADAAIVPAGTNGAIDIYVTHPTHVILDINGYFAP